MESSPGNFPRLLVVAAFAPSPVSGTLVRQLLKGYPASRLHWWTYDQPQPRDEDQPTDQLYHYPIPPRLVPYRKATRLKSWLVENFWVPRAAANLRQVVAEVNPDQIWAQLTSFVIPVLAQTRLVGTKRCHVSLWDYQNGQNNCRVFGMRRARRLVRLTEDLYRRTTTCDVISQPMWDDLARRTGRPDAIVVHSGFEPDQLEWLQQHPPEPAPEIEIAYAGSIIVPHVFRFFLRALDTLRPTLTRPIRLNLFGHPYSREPWFNGEWMRDHGVLPERQFIDTLRRCTWGFAPMDLTENDPNYTRYSFPNKFGTYLSAGLPLIVLAHRESSAAKMIHNYPAGVFSATTDPNELVRWLRTALEEVNPKARYRSEILRCAQTEFNTADTRRRLLELWRS